MTLLERRASCPLYLLLALLLTSSSIALERDNLRFYISFEDGIAPAIAAGRPGAGNTPITFLTGSEKDIQPVPGLRGRGLQTAVEASFQYAARESFSRNEGTIAFWIKPVGWSGLKYGWPFLYVRSDRNVNLHFYIYPGNLYYYISGPGHYYLINTAEDGNQKDPFKDGEWTFLAGTFKPGEQRFYVKGHFMNAMTEGLHEPEFTTTGIVEIPPSKNVLDEIMIFDRALTDKEIKAIYEANAP